MLKLMEYKKVEKKGNKHGVEDGMVLIGYI